MTDNQLVDAVESEAQEQVAIDANEETVEQPEAETQDDKDSDESEGEEQFSKKAVNALNRKKKQITKLRAHMRELEAKLSEVPKVEDHKEINSDDYDSYADYLKADMEANLEQKLKQSQTDMQKQQLEQQQAQLRMERDHYILEQAREASQVLTDLPQVWQQNATLLDNLPDQISDIFYSIDNAPAAIYTLAKEGKLETLAYSNPAIAAYEIVNAQNKGMEMLSRPLNKVSQAPEPITKARGTGSVKKQLTPNDNVLKSLGLKK